MTKPALSIVKCYWKHCDGGVTHKWLPSRTPGHLWVCKEHFDYLTLVHEVAVVEEGVHYTTVKVIPEVEENVG